MVPVIATSYSTSEIDGENYRREMVLECKHIPASDFRSFVMFDDKSKTEVLQKFVLCKSDKNNLIKCVWTPSLMTIQRRTNINSMRTKRNLLDFKPGESTKASANIKSLAKPNQVNFYERIVTFEGPDHMSVGEKIYSSYIIKDVQNAINSIVDHLEQQKTVLSSATFYFKYDRQDELVLVFATGIN